MVQSKPLARRAFIGFSCTRFRALPRSRPAAFLVCTSALARGGCHIMLRGGLGNSARVTDAVYWVVTIWFLHYATKAVKPATAPSTTSMAVTMGGSGVWPGIVHSSPAAQGIVRFYCSSGGVCPGGLVCTVVSCWSGGCLHRCGGLGRPQ